VIKKKYSRIQKKKENKPDSIKYINNFIPRRTAIHRRFKGVVGGVFLCGVVFCFVSFGFWCGVQLVCAFGFVSFVV
jgi:hypothetical protein